MNKIMTISLAAAAALATSGMAQAQAPADSPASPRASREIHGQRGAQMTKDRAVQMADQVFARLDANKDGTLNDADRAARQQAMFERLDADGNGAVSLAEFQAARSERQERGGQRGEQRAERDPSGERGQGHRRMGSRGMGGGMGGGMGAGMVRGADANEDGAVSQAEFRTAMLARFDATDADGNGTVSREERRAMRTRAMPPRAPAS